MRNIQAALFDLDGTLTNTLQDIADAMNRALTLNGLPTFPVDDYRYLVGDGVKKLAERAVRERRELAEQVQGDYQAWYRDHTRVTTRPYDGIPELLRTLCDRGVKVCVFSNKPHADTVNVVRFFFPDIPFADVRGQTAGVPVKPDPKGALLTAHAADVAPSDFVYLGDTSTDMRCAVNAGMHAVGVTWGFRPAQELLDSGAQALISHPLELLDLLTDDR